MSTENGQQQYDEDEDYNDAQEPENAEGGKDRIPAGYHNVRGIAGTMQQGYSTSGTEQVSVGVKFFELEGEPEGTTIFYFSEKAEVDSVKKLKAMGWDGSDDGAGIDANVVRASVKYETYEGKRRMKIDVFAGGRFEMKNQMDGEQKKSFFARLRAIDTAQASAPPAKGSAPAKAGPNGYPKDWDQKGPPKKPAGEAPKGAPRVNL